MSNSQELDIDGQDRAFHLFLKGLSTCVLGLFAVLIFFLFQKSWPTLSARGLGFFTSSTWSPNQEKFGLLAFVYGTLSSSLIALCISVPISISTALFLTELSPAWVRVPLGFLVDMLASVPSVIYGLWGIYVLAPWIRDHLEPSLQFIFGSNALFQGQPLGIGLLCAGMILAIMITPTITSISREIFKAVPRIVREGALALGATHTEMIYEAVLKSGMSGVVGACILGLGRALGETMAVTMVIGNRADISFSLFKSASTMSSVIANEFAEADSIGLHMSSLSLIGLSLFVVALIVNLSARLIIQKMKRAAEGAR